MSNRRRARSGPRRVENGVPPELIQQAVPGGFWDSRGKVEGWLALYDLGLLADSFYAFPPGLRQECIYRWAAKMGLVNKYGLPDPGKLHEAGVVIGPGKHRTMAKHSSMFSNPVINHWRFS